MISKATRFLCHGLFRGVFEGGRKYSAQLCMLIILGTPEWMRFVFLFFYVEKSLVFFFLTYIIKLMVQKIDF